MSIAARNTDLTRCHWSAEGAGESLGAISEQQDRPPGEASARRPDARVAPLSRISRGSWQETNMRISSPIIALGVCLSGAIVSLEADRRSFEFSEVIIAGAVLTNAQGINAAGDIVGIYRDAGGRTHGFVVRKGEVTTIDYPGALATEARGISPDGKIVGSYRLAGEPAVNIHGFLLDVD